MIKTLNMISFEEDVLNEVIPLNISVFGNNNSSFYKLKISL